MPVIVSCGSWNQAGWFLQRLGGVFRWHVGGVDCDGGRPAVGKWTHLAGVFDGRTARLYQDGVQVAQTAGKAAAIVWPGELCVGQYSAAPGSAYQVTGKIRGVRLYHRPLTPAETAASASQPPLGL